MPKNEDIGRVRCPFTGELAPVRRNKNGRLYYQSAAGLISPSTRDGQDWLLDNAEIFGPGGKPKDEEPGASSAPPPDVKPEPTRDEDADPNPVTVTEEPEPKPEKPAEAASEETEAEEGGGWLDTIL